MHTNMIKEHIQAIWDLTRALDTAERIGSLTLLTSALSIIDLLDSEYGTLPNPEWYRDRLSKVGSCLTAAILTPEAQSQMTREEWLEEAKASLALLDSRAKSKPE